MYCRFGWIAEFAIDGISREMDGCCCIRGQSGSASMLRRRHGYYTYIRCDIRPLLQGGGILSPPSSTPGPEGERLDQTDGVGQRTHVMPWEHPPARGSAVHPLSPTASHTLVTLPVSVLQQHRQAFYTPHSPSGGGGTIRLAGRAGTVSSLEADPVLPPPIPALPGQKDWVIGEIGRA